MFSYSAVAMLALQAGVLVMLTNKQEASTTPPAAAAALPAIEAVDAAPPATFDAGTPAPPEMAMWRAELHEVAKAQPGSEDNMRAHSTADLLLSRNGDAQLGYLIRGSSIVPVHGKLDSKSGKWSLRTDPVLDFAQSISGGETVTYTTKLLLGMNSNTLTGTMDDDGRQERWTATFTPRPAPTRSPTSMFIFAGATEPAGKGLGTKVQGRLRIESDGRVSGSMLLPGSAIYRHGARTARTPVSGTRYPDGMIAVQSTDGSKPIYRWVGYTSDDMFVGVAIEPAAGARTLFQARLRALTSEAQIWGRLSSADYVDWTRVSDNEESWQQTQQFAFAAQQGSEVGDLPQTTWARLKTWGCLWAANAAGCNSDRESALESKPTRWDELGGTESKSEVVAISSRYLQMESHDTVTVPQANPRQTYTRSCVYVDQQELRLLDGANAISANKKNAFSSFAAAQLRRTYNVAKLTEAGLRSDVVAAEESYTVCFAQEGVEVVYQPGTLRHEGAGVTSFVAPAADVLPFVAAQYRDIFATATSPFSAEP